MKKIVVYTFAAVIFFWCACKTGEGNPQEVTEEFFTALKNKDFEQAKKFATKESQSMLDLLNNFAKQDAADTSGNGEQIYVSNQKINGDNATVDVMTGDNKIPVTVNLKREEGLWKVAFDKNSIMKIVMDAGKQSGDAEKDINNSMDSLKDALDSLPGEMDSLRRNMER